MQYVLTHVRIISNIVIFLFAAFLAGAQMASASPKLLTPEDFSRTPALSGISMSREGDMLVGLIVDPEDPTRQAPAYWDLTGELDWSQPLVPSHIMPSEGQTRFYSGSALKHQKSLWQTVQPYVGFMGSCGESDTRVGAAKTFITKPFMADARLETMDDLPSGRAEVGANKAQLRCFELSGETNLVSLLPLQEENVLLSRNSTKNGRGYFVHNLTTGREKFITRISETEQIAISSINFSPLFKSDLRFVDGDWITVRMLPDASGKFVIQDVLTTKLKDRYSMDVSVQERIGMPPTYHVVTDKFSDHTAAYIFDPETQSFSDEPAIAHPDFSVQQLLYSTRQQDYGEILGFIYATDSQKIFWLDPELKSIQAGLEASFPGKQIGLAPGNMTDDLSRILVKVSAPNMPPTDFLLVDKSKLISIGSSMPWVSEDQFGKSELIYYAARDGLRIPAIVTFPAGYTPGTKARGAIVLPHGGPWARDYVGFNRSGWIQYFANRGYVILQPQYRGSQGLGRELWLAGDREWGLKMQDDKDDGAQWLIDKGYVAEDKIAIHGYSYGGFAAIAASVRPGGPFQCAIAGAGVANLTRLGNSWGANRLQRLAQGHTVAGMDPMKNTDKIDIPILLYHGDHDVRVPDWHSREFYNAIKKKSPQSEFISFKQMGHQRNKWAHGQVGEVLTHVERFLNTTCGMGPGEND